MFTTLAKDVFQIPPRRLSEIISVSETEAEFAAENMVTQSDVWVVLPDSVNITQIYSIDETDAAVYLPVISHKI